MFLCRLHILSPPFSTFPPRATEERDFVRHSSETKHLNNAPRKWQINPLKSAKNATKRMLVLPKTAFRKVSLIPGGWLLPSSKKRRRNKEIWNKRASGSISRTVVSYSVIFSSCKTSLVETEKVNGRVWRVTSHCEGALLDALMFPGLSQLFHSGKTTDRH